MQENKPIATRLSGNDSIKPHFFPEKLLELPAYSERFAARKVHSEQVEIYFASYPARTVSEEHQHDTDNYGVITKGKLFLIIDGKEKVFGVGDWYHVPAGKPHAARFEEDTAEIELWFKKYCI